MVHIIPGRDAAFPQNLRPMPPGAIALGYYGGPDAYNVWPDNAWPAFDQAVPMWVGGLSGATEGASAVAALRRIGVPPGVETILDMEQRKDRTYVQNFGDTLQDAGYKVLVYGSTSSVFLNPQLNGYAVADPTGVQHMYPHHGVRITQWGWGPLFDNDAIREWLLTEGQIWRPKG